MKRRLAFYLWTLLLVVATLAAHAQDPLPSWNDGPAKQAILDLDEAKADPDSPKFVPPEQHIATFDQDGTTWVEHPIYTQVDLRHGSHRGHGPGTSGMEGQRSRFKSILAGDKEAMAKFTHQGTGRDRHGDPYRHDEWGSSRQKVKNWLAKAQASAFPAAPLHRADLPAHAGGEAFSGTLRLQNLHRDWRRAGLRPRVCGSRFTASRRSKSSAQRYRNQVYL